MIPFQKLPRAMYMLLTENRCTSKFKSFFVERAPPVLVGGEETCVEVLDKDGVFWRLLLLL